MTTRDHESGQGPTVARRLLGHALRDRRTASKMTLREAASLAGIDPTTLSRIENAAVKAEPGTALMLLDGYKGVDAKTREAVKELAFQARTRGWWQRYSKGIPDWFANYIGLETGAKRVSTYECDLIPGLLQTNNYTQALIMSGVTASKDEKEASSRIALRNERQQRVLSSNNQEVSAVIGEAALRRMVGGPETMRGQLAHLMAASENKNIRLQVLPFSSGNHPANYGSFVLLYFDQPSIPVVYLEYAGSGIYLEDAKDAETHETIFMETQAAALSVEDSTDMITSVLEELPSKTEV